MIGIDVDALNRQVEEKRRLATEEQEKDSEADRQALLVAERGMLLERQVELQRRQRSCDDAAYNHAYQRKQFRREFDLSNPDVLKNDLPVRIGDGDPRLGVSSVQVLCDVFVFVILNLLSRQVLHGEDGDYGVRPCKRSSKEIGVWRKCRRRMHPDSRHPSQHIRHIYLVLAWCCNGVVMVL